jgi:hypothetical protein
VEHWWTKFLVVKTLQQHSVSGLQSTHSLACLIILVTAVVLVPIELIIQMAEQQEGPQGAASQGAASGSLSVGWVHSRWDRQSVNNGTMRKLFSDPHFFWSTDVRSKKLVPDYLQFVCEGIKQAALDLRFPLDPDDVAWLEVHQGRFQMHIPLSSEHHKTKITSVQLKGKPFDAIAEHCLTKNHQVLLVPL